MNTHATPSRAGVMPTLRYRDATAAIDWLCRAFGFEARLVVPGENGCIAHAQLAFGNGMVMLGSAREDALARYMQPPASLGGTGTHCVYIVVADADAHYAQAKAAGATIVFDIKDEEHGGRGYGCTDPEGHLWYFGTYDPWA